MGHSARYSVVSARILTVSLVLSAFAVHCHARPPVRHHMGISLPDSVPETSIRMAAPRDGAAFAPGAAGPTFVWRDDNPAAVQWEIEIRFEREVAPIRIEVPARSVPSNSLQGNGVTQETTWTPDPQLWAKVTRLAGRSPVRIVVRGLSSEGRSVSAVFIQIWPNHGAGSSKQLEAAEAE